MFAKLSVPERSCYYYFIFASWTQSGPWPHAHLEGTT
jgi:hypothetical protein